MRSGAGSDDGLHEVLGGVEQVLGSIHDEQLAAGPERRGDIGKPHLGTLGDPQGGGERRDQVLRPRDPRDR